MKTVATAFDASTWDAHGLQWVRAAKSTGCSGLVVDLGLSAAAKEKLSELKFRVVSSGEAKVGPYAALLETLKEGEKCLWSTAEYDFKSVGLDSLFAGEGLACVCDGGLPLPNMVLPISNIHNRAKAARLIEEKVIPVYKSALDTRLMCGDLEAWAGFLGYYDYLLHSAYLEARLAVDRIALNLYAANFPGRVTSV